jgi:hypothetical protein
MSTCDEMVADRAAWCCGRQGNQEAEGKYFMAADSFPSRKDDRAQRCTADPTAAGYRVSLAQKDRRLGADRRQNPSPVACAP